MRSAFRIVLSRWAITNEVRPRIKVARAGWISRSLLLSRLLVASSRMKIVGSASTARAIASRCRWPPLSLTPRSPISVS